MCISHRRGVIPFVLLFSFPGKNSLNSGENQQTLVILNFHVFNPTQFFLIVQVGPQKPDSFNGSPPMRGADGERRIDSIGLCPFGPASLD